MMAAIVVCFAISTHRYSNIYIYTYVCIIYVYVYVHK